MKSSVLVLIVYLLSSFLLISCAGVTDMMESKTGAEVKVDTTLADELGPYSGPRARLAVSRFEWKVGNRGSQVTIKGVPGTQGITISREQDGYMSGLQDMLTTALFQSKRFRVVERQELGEVMQEQKLRQTGVVSKETAAKSGVVKGADILVVAAITGWEPGTSGASAGGGSGLIGGTLGKAFAIGGALTGAMKKSSMAMDIRLIDSSTSEILAATNLEGVAKDVNFGALVGGFMGGVGMGGGLSGFAKTPMEKAIRTCIYESVKFLVNETPKEYYKY
ncbi:MAG: CsgG/HfaB family protein [Thermodesulfobacteriota bacterium]